ncbi:hypothetical protein Smp_122760.1 [Schistosoma mansoni]|uniref:hypothetical protein n=1 Tax=Schistosoma mansoni TaxID=6183 RepID=UPI0001A63267|nr:hypothetical protein Smp_122760.1 [Schistosoma mansoni]|eukprot:XP_018650608.1 hypothetical protein Smp_122760.1 [Schistosoma mansoni]
MFNTIVSEIQSLRDTIVKADPNGTKNIDESIQDLRGNYQKQFPDVHFKLSKLVKYFKESAARSKDVMSQYSMEKCNTLIPHRTADVILMDENINEKFEIGKEFDIYFFNEDFLSQILKVMNNVKTK